MGKALMVGSELQGEAHAITVEKLVAFERVIWQRDPNTHSDPEVARKRGMSRPIASGQNQLAFLHQLMENNFADGWTRGGDISVRWLRPVYAGDLVTPRARIQAITPGIDGARVDLEVWCENQNGEKTSAGTAHACLR